MKCYDCPYRPGRLHVDIELQKPVYSSTFSKQTCISCKPTLCQKLKYFFLVDNDLLLPLLLLLWCLRKKLAKGQLVDNPLKDRNNESVTLSILQVKLRMFSILKKYINNWNSCIPVQMLNNGEVWVWYSTVVNSYRDVLDKKGLIRKYEKV